MPTPEASPKWPMKHQIQSLDDSNKQRPEPCNFAPFQWCFLNLDDAFAEQKTTVHLGFLNTHQSAPGIRHVQTFQASSSWSSSNKRELSREETWTKTPQRFEQINQRSCTKTNTHCFPRGLKGFTIRHCFIHLYFATPVIFHDNAFRLFFGGQVFPGVSC